MHQRCWLWKKVDWWTMRCRWGNRWSQSSWLLCWNNSGARHIFMHSQQISSSSCDTLRLLIFVLAIITETNFGVSNNTFFLISFNLLLAVLGKKLLVLVSHFWDSVIFKQVAKSKLSSFISCIFNYSGFRILYSIKE